MASRASWRILPDDPRTPLGWLGRDARRWPRLLLRKALLGIAGLAVYAAVVGSPWAFLALALAFGALAATSPGLPKGPPTADPSPGLLFSGRLEVRRDGALLGDDRVSATFVDGWLHVEGFRTAFALRGEDVANVADHGLGTFLTLADGSGLCFRVALDPRPHERTTRGTKANFTTFDREIRRWRERFVPEGESVLPPDRPHASAWVRARTDLAASTVGFFATLFAFVGFGVGWGLATSLLFPGPALSEAIRAYARLRRTAA